MKRALVSSWIWIIGGLLVGVSIVGMFISILDQMSLQNTINYANTGFENLYSVINALCESDIGEGFIHKIRMPDVVTGIYVSDSPTPSENINIESSDISFGDYLCIKIEDRKPRCKKLSCETEMRRVIENTSVLSLIDKIMKRRHIFSHVFEIKRTECGVSVLKEGEKLSINYDRAREGVRELVKSIITLQIEGDYQKAKQYFEKYTAKNIKINDNIIIPENVPVDINPQYEYDYR